MKAQLRKFGGLLAASFWILPGSMVMGGVLLAVLLVGLDRSGAVSQTMIDSPWLYSGGAKGARTLLGAVASSAIGVAGTVFSITIAALSLTAGQMGPRLLRNFTKDHGNQASLGAFLGTFAYALIVLRTVRTEDEGTFVPHLALTVAVALALVCVAVLVYFINHMAGRINVDTVIELVGRDAMKSLHAIALAKPGPPPPAPETWRGAVPVTDPRRGYLQQLDGDGLADWAAARGTRLRLLVRPGDYIFPGTPVALAMPAVDGVAEAVAATTALGPERVDAADLEFAMRQLVEVGIRALSPSTNDPFTAMSVLDRLGAALCDLADLHLPDGTFLRDGRAVLVVPHIAYDGLLDTMFHMMRQDSAGSAAVQIRMLEVLTSVAMRERAPARLVALARHADLVLASARRHFDEPADLDDLLERHRRFHRAQRGGAAAVLEAADPMEGA